MAEPQNQPKTRLGKVVHFLIEWVIRFSPLATVIVLSVSVYVARDLYNETQNQNKLVHKGGQNQLELLRKSLDQNTTATIYTMGLEVSKVLVQHPEIRVYFDRYGDYRALPKEEIAQRQNRLNKRFDKESDKTKQLIWSYCEIQADFYEYVFLLRHLIRESDWKGWWTYFTDVYDESHLLRAYMTSRPGWYQITKVLAQSEQERKTWYSDDQKEIQRQKTIERNKE